jgi:hypothetical protein
MPAGGGLLQLVSQGKQDVDLTGNPEITFFKMVYRRHTNFAVESQVMYFDGTPTFGQRITCLVPRSGDLLGRIYLQVTLPQITLDASSTLVSYVNSIGHALIQEISIDIGEQEIDRQTGEWMELWTQLTTPASQRDALNAMIGRVDEYLPPDIIPSVNGLTLMIPLQFWFCRNPGWYLPLLALQYHPIRINIKLAPLQNLFWTNTLKTDPCQQVSPAQISNVMMWGDCIYLDTEERRRFVSTMHEYLIEQVQYTPPIAVTANQQVATIITDFNHPIKEFIFVAQRNDMIAHHEYFNYSSLGVSETLPATIPASLSNTLQPGQTRTDLITQALLQLEGQDRFKIRDASYFRLVQPYEHHTSTPVNSYIYVYSIALRPEDVQPTGTLNASRIDSVVWQIQMNNALNLPSTYTYTKGNCTIRVYALNYNVFKIVNGFGGLVYKI